ncbi:MAG TPA: LCP family protein [Jatrophihabitantaceae bacterium]|nr:LCP family protein [Jatrophihabitantaceae bacterium]
MPPADKRADYGPHAPLPPELNPRRGRSPKVPQQIRVGDLQARNPNAPTRGRHRASPSERETPPPPPLGGSAPPSSLRRATLLSGRVLLALISVGLLIGSGIAWATYRQFTQGIQHGQALPDLPKGTKRIDGGKDQNILLLGNDSIAGATAAEVRALGTTMDRSDSATDTMMILHIPADGKRATIISFPRDSWVSIPGHGMFKLNAAYLDGFNDAGAQGAKDLLTKQGAGILLVAQTLSELTGLHIDHYVQVNLLGFYEISEAIQGVNLCLNEAQNKYTEGDPSHPNGYSGINLKKGWNYNVKGTQALAFVRQRHGLPRGDIDRIVRQQYFLSAVFKKATSSSTLLNPFKLKKLLDSVKRSLITDPKLDILGFVQQFTKITGGNVSFATIPIVDPSFWEGDQEVVKVDPAAVKAFVDKLVGVPLDNKLQTAKTVPPSQVSVTVINEANRDHVATNNTNMLSQAGFLATVGPDTDQRTDQTAIEYPDGMQAQAKTLGRYVPGAVLELSSSVSKITLVLGSDGISASATPPATQPKPKTSTSAKPPSSPSPSPSGVTNAAQNSASCIN